MTNSKKIGNRHENKFAKRLSQWWFENKTTLSKHSDSGSTKDIYVGDIIPGKIENFTWNCWPFFIEVKGGYKSRIPTFYATSILDEWIYETCTKLTEYQYVPFLVLQFYKKTPVIFTTMLLNTNCNIAYSQFVNNQIFIFYWYFLKDLEQTNFLDLIPENIKNILIGV